MSEYNKARAGRKNPAGSRFFCMQPYFSLTITMSSRKNLLF